MAGRSMIPLILLAVCMGVATASAAPPEKAAVFRHQDVDIAWQAAQKNKRPLLLFVSTADCRFCTKMIRETYSHPQIARALATRCETTTLTAEQRPELVRQLGVRAFPTTIVVSPEGKELGRIEGFLDPQKFAARLFGAPKQDQARTAPPSKAPANGVAKR